METNGMKTESAPKSWIEKHREVLSRKYHEYKLDNDYLPSTLGEIMNFDEFADEEYKRNKSDYSVEEAKQVTEAKWLPRTLSGEAVDLVAMVSNKIEYDINAAMAFCVALLENVNAHPEAAKVNEILSGMMIEGSEAHVEEAKEKALKIPDVPFSKYAGSASDFIKEAERIADNGTMNMYVAKAIQNEVSSKEMEKEIKLAIKMHSKYDKQPGSSPLHSAVTAAMWTLLGMLRKSVMSSQVSTKEESVQSYEVMEGVDRFGLPVLTEAKEMWHIVSWTGAVKFNGKKFPSFEDAEEFLTIQLGDTYETDREEFEIIPFKGTRDSRYLDPKHPSGATKYAIEAKSMDDMLPGVNLIFLGMGMDKNGNKVVKLSFPNSRGFSIQTNGNMPKTHKMKGEINAAVIAKEAAAYIKAHGSEEQKKKLKVG